MRCTNCGELITEDPIWIDGKPFCSQECSDEMTLEDYAHDEDYQGDYEEELY